jgi:hypothetical protein
MFESLTRIGARAVVKSKLGSPRGLFIIGLIGVGAGTALAIRATLKVEPVLDDARNKLDDIHALPESYSGPAKKQDLAVVYMETGYQLTKLYAPSIFATFLGVACLTKSHTLLSRRNAALTAAYAGLDNLYKAYRKRIQEEIGIEPEDRLYKSVVREVAEKELERAPIKNNKGGLKDPSIYARFFDESSTHWNGVPEYNVVFLRAQQGFFNDMLHARGHVFLNEVYDQLGLERSRAGSVVGWSLDTEGDHHIDFGIFDGRTMEARDFVNGYNSRILLDFNVDGIITDKLRDWRPRP